MDGKPVLGCLTPTLRCVGKEILTIEGISSGESLHLVQKHLVKSLGLQCGFCTPGVVMTAIPFLEENPHASRNEIKESLSGNLCRCTGYKKIIDAVENAAEEMRS
jgi:carbon-monoxide dehydrogenase small subunit